MPNIKPTRKYVKFTDEEMEAAAWCLNNGIAISPIAVSTGSRKYFVEIISNGKRNNNGKQYDELESQRMVYDYYTYFYNKNKQ